jgi:hypothetical protein
VGIRCERCGDGVIADERLPDNMCWDRRARSDELVAWLRIANEEPEGSARFLLGDVGDERAADCLRHGLEASHPWVLASVVSGLGWSGDASDRERLLPLIRHDDRHVREAARASLTELRVPGLGELLHPLLEDVQTTADERVHIFECLAWVDDTRTLPDLRQLLVHPRRRSLGGLTTALAEALARLGTPEDRRAMAGIAVTGLREAVGGTPAQMWSAIHAWQAYAWATQAIEAAELSEVTAGLTDLPENFRHALRLDRPVGPLPVARALGERVVPRRSITHVSEGTPFRSGARSAKFGGQPDWRDTPAWPVGSDGRLLLFYGQLPLPDDVDRTAYIFLAGPEEWQPLGGGNAVVVQPGNRCHLPTRSQATGPQLYEWQSVQDRFRRRSRRVPVQERFLTFAEGADPTTWQWPEEPAGLQVNDEEDWNKIGGTPLWLQGPEKPHGDEWQYAFQFAADLADERGDAAICYGWTDGRGRAAFGWQCH